ncbi:MAG: helix-turn-helix domain-containing protein [Lachnospiraceae bacterium]|nr:helix-turn-helix domain-containing protein [Lachnospiraceae bacterium]
MVEIGVMIKEYLKENGITQVFLSKRTGIETSKLNLALNGSRRLSLEEYAAVCGALNVDTNKFLKPRLPV